ncbi:MAG: tetratricopeptide repeat protein [Candidatus Zixiibacteriota bacterium]
MTAARGYSQSVSHLGEAISFKPHSAESYYTLGNVLGRTKMSEEAASCFKMVLKLEPGNMKAYKMLGINYARMGKKDGVRECLETYLNSTPQDAVGTKGMVDSIQIEIQPNEP